MRTLLGSLLTFLTLAMPAAQAQNCKVSQTKGSYSASAIGSFLTLPDPLGPLAGPTVRIARVENDGKGNVKIFANANLGGFVFAEQYDGFLVVNPDCTSIVTFLIPLPVFGLVPFQFRGVLSDNFRQHDIILENIFGGEPNSTVVISLRQQFKNNCSNRDVNGGFLVNMRGVTGLAPGDDSGSTPFARLGRIAFDGIGSFSAATYTTNGTGFLTQDNFSGSYSVNSNCEFTMTYGGGTWFGVLGDNSASANLMVSVPAPPAPDAPQFTGTVISGTLKQQ
jgi:hypothetical protein